MTDLVNQQGQNDRGGKFKNQRIQADGNGVGENPPKVIAVEKIGEMPETHPVAAHDSFHGGVILKGDQRPVHGGIVEHQVIGHHRDHHDVQIFVQGKIAGQSGCSFLRAHCRLIRFQFRSMGHVLSSLLLFRGEQIFI
ncbi:hypothetical protein D3C75_1083360 [compost metagenome]